MHARVKSATAIRLGGAVLRMLGPGARQAVSSGEAAEGDGFAEPSQSGPSCEDRRGPNGYDRIVPAGTMLGTSLAAQSAFGHLIFEGAGARGARLLPVHVELRDVLAAGSKGGVSELTIAGSAAHDFAQSMRYAHIPGANRVLFVHTDKPNRWRLSAGFFNRERLAFLRPPLRLCGTILRSCWLPRVIWLDRYRPESIRQNV